MLVDLEVANGDQDDWERHPGGREEERVGQVRGAIPHAAQGLAVVHVVTPREKVGHFYEETEDPEADAHQDAAAPGVDLCVPRFVADVDVAIQADGTDVEQGTEAAGETETGDSLTEGWLVNKPYLAFYYAWEENEKRLGKLCKYRRR